jgi:hypothetical protein
MTESAPQDQLLDTFRYLCNTDNVNKQLSKQDVDEMRSILKQIPTPAVVNSDPTQHGVRTLPKFADRLKQRLETDSSVAGPDMSMDVEGDPQAIPEDTASHISMGSHASTQSRRRRPETDEQRKMKKNYLIILNQLKQEGHSLTQEYTLDDPLHEIKDEVDQIYSGKECSSWVNKWKSYIEQGSSVVEMGSMFIPKTPIQLQGLHEKIQKIHTSQQVDIDWQRLYYSMRRRKASNPILALIIAYGVAIASTHGSNWLNAKLKNMGLGGGNVGGAGGGGGGLDIMGLIQGMFSGGGGNQGGGLNLGALFGGGGSHQGGRPPRANIPTPMNMNDLPSVQSPPHHNPNNNSIPSPMNPPNPNGGQRPFKRRVFFE